MEGSPRDSYSLTEVDQFYFQPRIDHNVLVFNVTVDNGEIVQVRYCGKYLKIYKSLRRTLTT